jgi:hypothetical protein
MGEAPGSTVPKPTIWRLALAYVLFVGIAGGVMALLGERPLWAGFAGVGLALVLGMRKRSKEASDKR